MYGGIPPQIQGSDNEVDQTIKARLQVLFQESVDCFMNCFHSLFAVCSPHQHRHNSARIASPQTLMKIIFVFLLIPNLQRPNAGASVAAAKERRTTQQLLPRMPHVWWSREMPKKDFVDQITMM